MKQRFFSTIVGLEFDGVGEFRGAEDFLSKIINGDYGEYNRKNNIGNDLYKKYTTIPPYSLQKAIIEAYK